MKKWMTGGVRTIPGRWYHGKSTEPDYRHSNLGIHPAKQSAVTCEIPYRAFNFRQLSYSPKKPYDAAQLDMSRSRLDNTLDCDTCVYDWQP